MRSWQQLDTAKVHAYFHTNQARLGLKAQASLLRIIMASLGPQLVTFINIIKTEIAYQCVA